MGNLVQIIEGDIIHTVLTKSPLGDRLPFISTWGGIKALLGKNLVNNKKIRAPFHTKNRISEQFI